MSNTETLNIDSLVLDPFVSKLHLIRDIGKSSLQTLFLGCTRAFGEEEIKSLLITYCLHQLQNISNINQNESTSILRTALIRHHEKFNPSNPALLHILPTTVLSKCFSFLDIHTLLCSVELVSRDWFHVARLASSISDFPATANIPSYQQPFKLKRLTHATTLNYSRRNISSIENEIDLTENMDALKHIDRLYVDGVLPQFITKCPETFINRLNKIEINYASKMIESEFWKTFHKKCNTNLHVLRLQNIMISKQTHQSLIKFISCCKNLNEFECHRWRFSVSNMTINSTIRTLSEHCRSLKILRIEYCRINDKIIPYITKLMEYRLRSLSIINCNRLKMTAFHELGRKQQELLSKSIGSKQKHLYEFIIDDKMISGSIFDNLSGLKRLSISADHLSGNISYSALNRLSSLKKVTIEFRSSIDRLKSHSSSQFNWNLFFKELGKTLVYFECNCQIIKKSEKLRGNTTGNTMKLLSKEDYDNFMIVDFNIFIYITTYCKKLKTLKMSGWKFDVIEYKLSLDQDLEQEIKNEMSDNNLMRLSRQRSIKKTVRSNSMHFINHNKKNKQMVSLNNTNNGKYKKSKISYSNYPNPTRFDFSDESIKLNGNKTRPATTRYIASKTSKTTSKRTKTSKSKSPTATPINNNNNDSMDISSSTESILTMENLIMIPISSLLQQSQQQINSIFNHDLNLIHLDYMKLEWMFDFGDIPSLNTLNFWCDTVLGLNCQMSINEELRAGSVVILEWNQNWTQFIRPTIIHHQSGDIHHKYKHKLNTKQRIKKMRKQRENINNS